MSKLTTTCFIIATILHTAPPQGFADLPINERTSQDQKACEITRIGTSSYLAVWSSYLHDGSSGTIVARKFGQQGMELNPEFQVNQMTLGNQTAPAVAADTDGNLIIVWQSPSIHEDTDIFARCYDPNGQATTSEFQVNTHTQGEQTLPRIDTLNDGQFIMVWESENLPHHTRKAICGRLFHSNGQPASNEFIASDTPSFTCRFADVTANSRDNLVITWLEDRTTDAVKMRRFTSDGTPLAPSNKVNTEGFKSITWPTCDMNSRGQVIVTWDGDPKKASDDNIHARCYDPNGNPLGDAFLVNNYTAGAQRNPAVSITRSGKALFTWETTTADNDKDIRVRLFSINGQALTEEYTINKTRPGDQTEPTVLLSENRDLLILWQSKNQDGSGWGIYAKFGPTLLSADLNADTAINFIDYQILTDRWYSPPGPADLHEDHQLDYLDLWTFCNQWLKSTTSE